MSFKEFIYAYWELQHLKRQYLELYLEYREDKKRADASIQKLLHNIAQERHTQGLLAENLQRVVLELKRYRGW